MNDTDNTLYPIGDVARRTGLNVSAIRYYSDEGLVQPTDETEGGHRLYDVEAIARFEFIRTLRDLDTGLDQIRRVLTGVVSLPDLLAEHLDVVEHRAREVQSKRAVLRALVRRESTAARAKLLQRLVTMTDTDRQQLIDDFVATVSADLPDRALEKIRAAHPRLPEDPSPEQLDAWISLSELLSDERYREETRTYVRETYANEVGEQMSQASVQEFISSTGADVMAKLNAAREAGLSADDPQVIALADAFVQQSAKAGGADPDDDLTRRLATVYRDLEDLTSQAVQHEGYRATEGRYLELVAIINDEPHPDAQVNRLTGDGELRAFGPWLSDAILATIGEL